MQIANFDSSPRKGTKALRAPRRQSRSQFSTRWLASEFILRCARACARLRHGRPRTITGHGGLTSLRARIVTTDIALNLRERTWRDRESLLHHGGRCARNRFKRGCLKYQHVVKIDHDRHADALLLAYLRRLIEDRTCGAYRPERAPLHLRIMISKWAPRITSPLSAWTASWPRRQLLNNAANEPCSALVLRTRGSCEPLLRKQPSHAHGVCLPQGGFQKTQRILRRISCRL